MPKEEFEPIHRFWSKPTVQELEEQLAWTQIAFTVVALLAVAGWLAWYWRGQ